MKNKIISLGIALMSLIGIVGYHNMAVGATPVLQVHQGGTGSSTLSGILYGNGTSSVRSVIIGANLAFSGGTLSATAGSGAAFPFDVNSWGNSTTSVLGFTNGFISSGSSTQVWSNIGSSTATTFAMPSITDSLLWTNANGKFVATTTGLVSAGTGISVTASRYVIGGALTITNDGVTSISATSPLVNNLSTGAISLTCPTCVTVATFPSNATTTLLAFNGGLTTTNATSSASFYSNLLQSLTARFTDVTATGTLTIPNGATPVVSVIGGVAVDTTDGDLLFATSTNASYPAVVRSQPPLFRFKVGSTTQAYASTSMDIPTDIRGFTVTGVSCYVEGGTSVAITLTDASANSTNSVTCSTTRPTTITAFTSNNLWTAGERIGVVWGTKTGTVDYVNITLYGHWTRT